MNLTGPHNVNFFYQVIDGAYDGVKLNCTDQAILSDYKVDNSWYKVPLEIMPAGQFEPLYKTTLSVQVSSSWAYCCFDHINFILQIGIFMLFMWKDGELPVLPLSVYGAVAMAHSEVSEEYSSPFQIFFYLYDKRSVSLLHYFPNNRYYNFILATLLLFSHIWLISWRIQMPINVWRGHHLFLWLNMYSH